MAGQEYQLNIPGEDEAVTADYYSEELRTQAARLVGGYTAAKDIELSLYDPNDGLAPYQQQVGFGD